MNNNQYNHDDDDNFAEINRLKEENYFLKEQVRRLNAKVTGLNSLSKDQNIDSPLVEYYLNRYNEIHNFILEKRTAVLDNEIKNADDLYNEIISREDHIEEIAKQNLDIEEKIKALDEEIATAKKTLQEASDHFQQVAFDVTSLENNLYHTTMDYYHNLLAKLSMGDMEDAYEYMTFLVEVLRYTIYGEVVTYLNKATVALDEFDKLNELENETNKNLETYEKTKENLKSQIEVISFEEAESKLDALILEITTKKTTKEELISLFADLKKQNEKRIKDEIKHFQILEYSNQQIASKMDNIILELRDNITVADTSSNILLNKKLALAKLKEKLETISPFKDNYDNLNNEYNELQAMYGVISKNLDDIEDYLSSYKSLMATSQKFNQIVQEYSQNKCRLEAINKEYSNMLIQEKNLTASRKDILNNPYGKTDLMKLDEKLKLLQNDISKYEEEIKNIEYNITHLKQLENNFKVISAYDDYILCETKLPNLYEKQRSLSAIINDKYIEVSNAKMKCSEYDELQKQIEELENEINNL